VRILGPNEPKIEFRLGLFPKSVGVIVAPTSAATSGSRSVAASRGFLGSPKTQT
jgi:hypothetical protein